MGGFVAHRAHHRAEGRERCEDGEGEGGGHEEHGSAHGQEGAHEQRPAPQPVQQGSAGVTSRRREE